MEFDYFSANAKEFVDKNGLHLQVHPGAVIVLHDRAAQWKQTPQVLKPEEVNVLNLLSIGLNHLIFCN